MKELVGEERENHTGILAGVLRESCETDDDNNQANESDPAASGTITVEDGISTDSKPADQGEGSVISEPIIIDENVSSADAVKMDGTDTNLIQTDDIEVKREELEDSKSFLTFTTAEDSFLKEGFVKYAKSRKKWSDILKDEGFQFQRGRTRDSLRMRATTLGLQRSKTKGKSKSKKNMTPHG